MKLKLLTEDNIQKLRDLKDKQYPELNFPDFSNSFLMSFIIEDDDGELITGGGIRLIPEAIIFTDKNQSIHVKKSALIQLIGAFLFTCAAHNQSHLYAFCDDDSNWQDALKNFGFKQPKSLLFKKEV